MYLFFWCAWTLKCFTCPMDPSDLCALSGTILGVITDWVKGSNSELQNLKQHKTQQP